MIYPKFKAATVHAAPVFLNREATTLKVCDLIREAARNGAELVVFPEAFIPAFPVWAALWAPIYNHDFFKRMVANSVVVDGPQVQRICQEAKKNNIFVSIGISETNPVSVGGIWNSNLLISDEGEILNHHRKLVPTFYEKMVWAPGDGAGLQVSNTRLGKIGALICGENTNPLARFSLMAQGEQIHISAWPPIWPTEKPSSTNTAANYDIAAAVRIRAGAHSFEAKAFGIVSSGFMDKAMRDYLVSHDNSVADILDQTPRSVSMFIGPSGKQIGDSLQNDEGILYAEIDVENCVEPKQFHDVVGYYNRFDIFNLTVNRTRLEPISFNDTPVRNKDQPTALDLPQDIAQSM
jgi:aliphatic nitrilase